MAENLLAAFAEKHGVEYEPSKLAWALLAEIQRLQTVHREEQARSAERLYNALERNSNG